MAKEIAKTAPPIIDVAQPGKSAPGDSSKPIMVTNRPMMLDPMVNATNNSSAASAPLLEAAADERVTKLPPSQKKKVIMPISENEAPATDTETPVKVSVATSAPILAADSIPDEVSAEPEEPAVEDAKPVVKKAEAPKPSYDVADDTEVTEDALPKIDEQQVAAEAAASKKVDDLVKTQKYALPINAIERRRSKQIVIGGLLLIIVLALLWLDLAADAGFIHLPGLPLTHFFRV